MTLLERLKVALAQQPDVQLAVVFGSAARGALHARSDVDIGLSLVRGAAPVPALRVLLERAIARSVDLVWLDEAPPLLRFEIARDGVVLVEHERHAWAEFRAHAMIDWWDWAPTARMLHETVARRLREEAMHGSS